MDYSYINERLRHFYHIYIILTLSTCERKILMYQIQSHFIYEDFLHVELYKLAYSQVLSQDIELAILERDYLIDLKLKVSL